MKMTSCKTTSLLCSSNEGEQMSLASVHVTRSSWKASVIGKAMEPH